MRILYAGRLFLCHALWRLSGLRVLGRVLVRALGAQDEDVRAIAGTLLGRGGSRAVPLLREAIRRRDHLPLALSLLGDVGNIETEAEIRAFAEDPDPRVAQAAREALRVVERRAREGERGIRG